MSPPKKARRSAGSFFGAVRQKLCGLGREMGDADFFPLEPRTERGGRFHRVGETEHGTQPQGRENVPQQRILGQPGEQAESVVGGEAGMFAVPFQKCASSWCVPTTPLGMPVEPEVNVT